MAFGCRDAIFFIYVQIFAVETRYFASPVLRVSRTSRLPYFASPVLRVSRTVSPTSPSLIYPSEAQLFAASHWLYLPYPEIAEFPCTF